MSSYRPSCSALSIVVLVVLASTANAACDAPNKCQWVGGGRVCERVGDGQGGCVGADMACCKPNCGDVKGTCQSECEVASTLGTGMPFCSGGEKCCIESCTSKNGLCASVCPGDTIFDTAVAEKAGCAPTEKCCKITQCAQVTGGVCKAEAACRTKGRGKLDCDMGQVCCLTDAGATQQRATESSAGATHNRGSIRAYRPTKFPDACEKAKVSRLGKTTKEDFNACQLAWDNAGQHLKLGDTLPDWLKEELTEPFNPWKLFRDVNRDLTKVRLGGSNGGNPLVQSWATKYNAAMAKLRTDGIMCATIPFKKAHTQKVETAEDLIAAAPSTEGCKVMMTAILTQPMFWYYAGTVFNYIAHYATAYPALAQLAFMYPVEIDIMKGGKLQKDQQGRPTAPHIDDAYAVLANSHAAGRVQKQFPPFYFVVAEAGATRFLGGNYRNLIKSDWSPGTGDYWKTQVADAGVDLTASACVTTAANGYGKFYDCYSKQFKCYEDSTQNGDCLGQSMLQSWIGANNGILYDLIGPELNTFAKRDPKLPAWPHAVTAAQSSWDTNKCYFRDVFKFTPGGPIEADVADNVKWEASNKPGNLALMTGYQLHYGGWAATEGQTRWFMRFAFAPDKMASAFPTSPELGSPELPKKSTVFLERQASSQTMKRVASRLSVSTPKDKEIALEKKSFEPEARYRHMD